MIVPANFRSAQFQGPQESPIFQEFSFQSPHLIEIPCFLKEFLLHNAITVQEYIPTFDLLSQCASLSHLSLLLRCSCGQTMSCFGGADTFIPKHSSYLNGHFLLVCHPTTHQTAAPKTQGLGGMTCTNWQLLNLMITCTLCDELFPVYSWPSAPPISIWHRRFHRTK